MLDEATDAFVGSIRNSGSLRPLTEMTATELRESIAGLADLIGPGPAMRRAYDVTARASDEPVVIRVLEPVEQPRAAIVYLHGGGWVTGSVDEFDALGRTLAEQTGCAVVLVDYRLAPEHPAPAATEDAWAGFLWTAENYPGLPLVIAGDSSGGNLAAVVAQRSASGPGPRLALQVLVYPVLAADFDTSSYLDEANNLLVDRVAMQWYWDQYVPNVDRRAEPDVAPLHATDLEGLPAAVIVTAEHDVLRDEGEEYAQRLADAGVPVTLRRFEGQMHGFFSLLNILPGSRSGIDYVVEQINQQLTSRVA